MNAEPKTPYPHTKKMSTRIWHTNQAYLVLMLESDSSRVVLDNLDQQRNYTLMLAKLISDVLMNVFLT